MQNTRTQSAWCTIQPPEAFGVSKKYVSRTIAHIKRAKLHKALPDKFTALVWHACKIQLHLQFAIQHMHEIQKSASIKDVLEGVCEAETHMNEGWTTLKEAANMLKLSDSAGKMVFSTKDEDYLQNTIGFDTDTTIQMYSRLHTCIAQAINALGKTAANALTGCHIQWNDASQHAWVNVHIKKYNHKTGLHTLVNERGHTKEAKLQSKDIIMVKNANTATVARLFGEKHI